MTTFLFSELFLIVGVLVGWTFAEKYIAHMTFIEHDFEELFDKNPHPEIFDENGELDRGEYMAITFDPDYDPEEFDSEDLQEGG